MTMEKNNVPVHVSIIMDGNGRWAQERGLERVRGHVEGVESVRSCTEAAAEAGVKYLSLYAFSEENWSRPQQEVEALMAMMVKAMVQEMDNFMENRIRFVVLGHRSRLGDSLNQAIDEAMAQTADNDGMTLIVFLSYSGKWDILEAAKKFAAAAAASRDPEKFIASMDMDGFGNYLCTAGIPDPDLIIRTSGEQRISNYLLWQAAYTEFVFPETLWPDFRKPQFLAALDTYAKRDRRYGKVK